jgi:hypothetical protein
LAAVKNDGRAVQFAGAAQKATIGWSRSGAGYRICLQASGPKAAGRSRNRVRGVPDEERGLE